jgi:hypothetical protein
VSFSLPLPVELIQLTTLILKLYNLGRQDGASLNGEIVKGLHK